MLLSAGLPEFVYADSVFAYGKSGGITLVALGALAVGVGADTLWLRRFGARWPVAVVVLGAASLLAAWGLLAATADLGASDVYLGLWVALAGCLTATAAGVLTLVGQRSIRGITATASATASAPTAPPSPSPLARASGWLALVAGSLMVSATFAVRFVRDEQALVHPNLVWAWLFPGFVGLAAGILTLRLRRWPLAGPALTAALSVNLW